MKKPRLIGFAVLASAGVFLLPGRAAGQFLSPRSFLSGERYPTLAATLAASGTNPLGLQSALRPVSKEPGLLLLGGAGSETVRTVRDGQHTGDLWGRSRFTFLRVPLSGAQTEFYHESGKQSGIFRTDGGQGATADLDGETYSLRATFPLSGGASRSAGVRRNAGVRREWFVGYDDARADAAGQSNSLAGILPIFTGTPQASLKTRMDSVDVGGRFALGPTLSPIWIEAGLSGVQMSGAMSLSENTVSVSLPLRTQGFAGSVAVRHPLRSSELLAWAERSHGSGSGPARVVSETAVTLGDSDVSYSEQRFGMAWTRFYANGSRLTFLGEQRQAEMRVAGLGLLALPLGFSPDTVNRVSYTLTTNWRRRALGVTYERPYRNGSGLTVDYRYLETPFTARYCYSGRLFLFSTGETGEWNLPNARGHSLHLQYRLPLRLGKEKNPLVTVDATQFIPAFSLRRISGGSASGSNVPRKQTRGGWTAGVSVQYPF